MDFKVTIIRWQHFMAENTAMVILVILGVLALIFFILCFFLPGYLERRAEVNRIKAKQKRLAAKRPEM